MQEDGSRAMVFLNGSGIQSLYGVTAEEVKRKLLEDALDVPNVDRHAYFRSRLAELSAEARQVVGLILDTPEEMIQYLWGSKEKQITAISKGDLKQYLGWFYRWSGRRISRVFGELTEFVKDF